MKSRALWLSPALSVLLALAGCAGPTASPPATSTASPPATPTASPPHAIATSACAAGPATPVNDHGPAGPIPLVSQQGQIAFEYDNHVLLMNADGSGLTRLTDVPTDNYDGAYLSWSPDGRELAFVAQHDIFLLQADGTTVNLTNIPGSDSAPAWSPDGKQIAFATDRETAVGALLWYSVIYVMNPDGSGQARWGPGDRPVWSPDGRSIAFVDGKGGLGVMDHAGHPVGSLDASMPTNGFAGIAWSPDGTRLVYVAQATNGPFEIHVANLDGSSMSRLPTAPVASGLGDFAPDWSPDGKQIVFETNNQIYVMGADGSHPTRLTHDTDINNTPRWSPDGQNIVFDKGSTAACMPRVCIMSRNGGDSVCTRAADTSNAVWRPVPKS